MIREFKPEDLPTLLVIARKAWKPIFDNYKNQLGAELYPLVYPDPEEPFRIKEREIRAQAEKVPHEILICERDGNIAGFIFFGMRGKTGIICNNAKDPDSAERGVAQEMYAAVLEKFKAADLLGLLAFHIRKKRLQLYIHCTKNTDHSSVSFFTG